MKNDEFYSMGKDFWEKDPHEIPFKREDFLRMDSGHIPPKPQNLLNDNYTKPSSLKDLKGYGLSGLELARADAGQTARELDALKSIRPHIYVDARMPAELKGAPESFVRGKMQKIGPAFYGFTDFAGNRVKGLHLPIHKFGPFGGYLLSEGRVIISDIDEIDKILAEAQVHSDRQLEGMAVTTWNHDKFKGFAGVSGFHFDASNISFDALVKKMSEKREFKDRKPDYFSKRGFKY